MKPFPRLGRLDTTSIAGIAVFSALALILSAASQSFGLNFPLVPYLQFDIGEVAIVLAFFIFGPVPALASSIVEFGGLMLFGQSVPVGPLLKLIALLSTVLGLWGGAWLVSRATSSGMGGLVRASGAAGILTRAVLMTPANYYVLIYIYGLQGTVSYYGLPQAFSAIGITLTAANALLMILVFTAAFNALQLGFVLAVTYFVLRVPSLNHLRIGGKAPWFAAVTRERIVGAPEPAR